MNLQLGDEQIAQLAAEAERALQVSADEVGAYAPAYELILSFIDPDAAALLHSIESPDTTLNTLATAQLAARLESLDSNVREIAIWLVGAYMVNSGEGIFSSVIREYNRYQGVLRLGSGFTDSQLQLASNRVAQLVIDTVLGAKPPSIPTVQQVGDDDLKAIADTLYTANGDNMPGHLLGLNQAWPGIVMLNKFGETGYVDRLLQLDSTDAVSIDKLTDLQNLLYSWASFEYAYKTTSIPKNIGWGDLAVGFNIE
jgi:hypothetical protein